MLWSRRYVEPLDGIATRLMQGGKATSHDELARTAAVDEHGEGQRTESRGPVPGNAEATPTLHADSDGPPVSSLICPQVRLAYLRLLVASEALVCNEP